MTRADLRTRILEALAESESNPVFFSKSQIDTVINEGLEVLTEEAASVRRSAFVALRPGTIYYYTRGIAPDIQAPYRLFIPSLNRRLTAVSMAQLDGQHERWSTVTATGPEVWFPVAWDLFGIWPGVAAGGGILRVDYLAWPPSLTDDADVPEMLEGSTDALVLYGVYDGLMKQWDIARALAVFSLFLDRWDDARARAGFRQQQARMYRSSEAGGQPFRADVILGHR